MVARRPSLRLFSGYSPRVESAFDALVRYAAGAGAPSPLLLSAALRHAERRHGHDLRDALDELCASVWPTWETVRRDAGAITLTPAGRATAATLLEQPRSVRLGVVARAVLLALSEAQGSSPFGKGDGGEAIPRATIEASVREILHDATADPRLAEPFAGASRPVSTIDLGRTLAILARKGLVRELAGGASGARGATRTLPMSSSTLRLAWAAAGHPQLSSLSTRLLGVRKSWRAGPLNETAATVHAVMAAILRSGDPVSALCREWVVGAGKGSGGGRRVDLACWLAGDDPERPSAWVEVTVGRDESGSTLARLPMHLVSAIQTAREWGKPLWLWVVVDPREEDKVLAKIAQVNPAVRGGRPVHVRVVPIDKARTWSVLRCRPTRTFEL
jgi:hypothetical protein